ncbi:MAG TPA: hypothetical protein PKC43_06295 [Phycisphaerales bacterium]|nr:hypothetical protein [Phycisphaerales bacterium]HMP37042.1 hypothetical protein [Phycisphaerales bacterium]
MLDLLDRGHRFLAARQASHVSRAVQYVRTTGTALDVVATIGRTTFELATDAGGTQSIESRDYLIPAEMLPFDPSRGDRVIELVGTTQIVYEVAAPGGEAHWRWSDASRTRRRVHTKHVQTIETVPA